MCDVCVREMCVSEDWEDRQEEEKEGADTALKTKNTHINVGNYQLSMVGYISLIVAGHTLDVLTSNPIKKLGWKINKLLFVLYPNLYEIGKSKKKLAPHSMQGARKLYATERGSSGQPRMNEERAKSQKLTPRMWKTRRGEAVSDDSKRWSCTETSVGTSGWPQRASRH